MPQPKICVTCGTQYPKGDEPEICAICAEERQYIPESGQQWTNYKEVAQTHHTELKKINNNLYTLRIVPKFGIGQRAFLVCSEQGNILWDCIPLLDDQTVDFINQKGGVKAIALSHPHYYSNMHTWAETFECPIYIHKKDAPYIVFKSKFIKLWKGQNLHLWDDLYLVNLGGHFDGGCVLMIQEMTEEGVMLCSDILQIALSKKFIAMMYSYPNNIPLPLSEIKRIKTRLDKLNFDTLYGAFKHQNLEQNVVGILNDSVKRYFD